MSYILDALRRADAQRERDPSRGIHAQPAPLPAAVAPRRTGPWIALGVAAVAVAALAAYVLWQPASRPAEPAVAIAPALPTAPVVTAPVAAPIAPEATVATAIQPPAPPMPPATPRPAVQKVAAAPAPMALKVPAPEGAAAAAAPVAAPEPAAAQRIVAFAELPPDVQRELPKLAVSGGVYSENAAQRMLIVGGKVVGEGAELAPGVVLEQIRARSAVLKFKGWRYSVTF